MRSLRQKAADAFAMPQEDLTSHQVFTGVDLAALSAAQEPNDDRLTEGGAMQLKLETHDLTVQWCNIQLRQGDTMAFASFKGKDFRVTLEREDVDRIRSYYCEVQDFVVHGERILFAWVDDVRTLFVGPETSERGARRLGMAIAQCGSYVELQNFLRDAELEG